MRTILLFKAFKTSQSQLKIRTDCASLNFGSQILTQFFSTDLINFHFVFRFKSDCFITFLKSWITIYPWSLFLLRCKEGFKNRATRYLPYLTYWERTIWSSKVLLNLIEHKYPSFWLFLNYFWLFLLFWVKSSMQTRQLLDICSWCATSKGNYLTSMTYLSRKINLFFPRLRTINFRAKILSNKFRQTRMCYIIK